MKVSVILDFSKLLKEPKTSHNFNPSIAHWKNNLYFGCYRSFTRNKNKLGPFPSVKEDPNHPWFSEEFWQNGIDVTGFFILEITKDEEGVDEFKMKRTFNLGEQIYVIDSKNNMEVTEHKHIATPDARLIHLDKNRFLLSYNKYTIDPKYSFENGERCGEGETCTFIATREVEIILKNNNGICFYEEKIVCPNISKKTEKNWSFWKYNDKIFFSYGLVPTHKIYEYKRELSENNLIPCGEPILDKDNIYQRYEEIFNKEYSFMKVSVSTPAIPRKGSENRYIGVGHIKYFNTDKFFDKAEFLQTNPLKVFYNKHIDKLKHVSVDYLMFIYEFNPENGKITAISDMFIPAKTEYMLCFPTGLTYYENKLLIFYGDYDSKCKILMFENDILEKILKPVEQNFDMLKNMNYFVFPEKCINKEDFCSLLFTI